VAIPKLRRSLAFLLSPDVPLKSLHCSSRQNSYSGRKAVNFGDLGACVREDLMNLLIERNRLG
jgi:hypothetical protein